MVKDTFLQSSQCEEAAVCPEQKEPGRVKKTQKVFNKRLCAFLCAGVGMIVLEEGKLKVMCYGNFKTNFNFMGMISCSNPNSKTISWCCT